MKDSPRIMTSADLAPLSEARAGHRISYGRESLQFGELGLPAGPGPHPTIVNVHGGVWLAQYGIDHSRAAARAFVEAGFAVWNVEYRRIGNPGGAWPGTFLDVAAAADYLRVLVREQPLDLTRVCFVGHSAGGQLALWLAARPRIAATSELHSPDPFVARGVVALAPATELPTMYERGLYDHAAARLMGGSPEQYPERYAAVTPRLLAPIGRPQTLIVGAHDTDWAWNSRAYVAAAKAAGDTGVSLIELPDAGHFELIAPRSSAWPIVVGAARQMVL